MREIARQIVPRARHVLQVLRLAVALQKPHPKTDETGIALRAERRIAARKVAASKPGSTSPPRRSNTRTARRSEIGRHVDARILQQRHQIVGPVLGQRVLEVDHADVRGPSRSGSQNRFGE